MPVPVPEEWVDDWPTDCLTLEAVAHFAQPGRRHAGGFYSWQQ